MPGPGGVEDEGRSRGGGRLTRREVLGTLGVLGAAAAAGGACRWRPRRPRPRRSDSNESVEAGLARVFGGRPMKDGAGLIKLDVPLIAENGAVVPVAVEVNVADDAAELRQVDLRRRRPEPDPVVTRVALSPEAGKAYMGANIRLGETGRRARDRRAERRHPVQIKREVKVTVGGCGG